MLWLTNLVLPGVRLQYLPARILAAKIYGADSTRKCILYPPHC